eukprot:scaffold137346_cov148-Phaeocystis_antarctica.AAC.4
MPVTLALPSLERAAARDDEGESRPREGGGALEAKRVGNEAGGERRVADNKREACERRRCGRLELGEGGHGCVEERLERVVVVRLRRGREDGGECVREAVLRDGTARSDRVDDAAHVLGDRCNGEAVGKDRADNSGARGPKAVVEPHDVVGSDSERARCMNEREQRCPAGRRRLTVLVDDHAVNVRHAALLGDNKVARDQLGHRHKRCRSSSATGVGAGGAPAGGVRGGGGGGEGAAVEEAA